ncbi:MAG: hypothetical protein ACIARR_01210 [Phycisphaerales bacterium JB059]
MRTGLIAMVAGLAVASPAAAQRGRASEPSEMAQRVRELAQGVLASLEQSGDFGAAQRDLGELLDRTIRYASDKELDAIVQAHAPLLVVAQLAQADRETQGALFPVLREHEELAWTLATLVDPEHDSVPGVYRTLATLVEAHGAKKVAVFDNLAAAICVVHDAPYELNVDENTARSMPPAEVFAYFADHARELANDPVRFPADLLTFVVDTTENAEEMAWALGQYRRDVNLGNRFEEIDYDDKYYEDPIKNPKKLTASGQFSLRAIKEYGGVTSDQVYFAMQVGKAKGIPTAYISARGSRFQHVWLGYLQTRGRNASWDFESGRNEAYEGIRGDYLDPQTRRPMSEAMLGLLADHVSEEESKVREARSVAAAAARLGAQRAQRGYQAPTAPPDGVTRPGKFTPRTHSVEDQLALLEAGLRMTPANADGWRVLIDVAERQELSVDQMDEWGRVIERLCGRQYPDFMVETLSPMFRSVQDVDEQSKLWGWLYDRLRRRPDLAGEVLMNQGELMRRANRPEAAWAAYNEVINRFANQGTAIIGALDAAEQMIREQKGGSPAVIRRDIIPTYERAWRQIRRPRDLDGAFGAYSTWYRVGARLAALWREIGEIARARGIESSLRSDNDNPFDDD